MTILNNNKEPSVVPVVMPRINWSLFLGALRDSGHPKVTEILDRNRVDVEDLPALTLVLSSIFHGESNMVNAIKEAGSLLNHTQVSFFVDANVGVLAEIAVSLDLGIITKGEIAVVSGSLHQWRIACIEGTSYVRSYGCRLVFNLIVRWLERGALTHLWWGYRKKANPDKTFSLALG